MKIYVLLMLIGVIVGFSRLPVRRPAKGPAPVSPAPAAAGVPSPAPDIRATAPV